MGEDPKLALMVRATPIPRTNRERTNEMLRLSHSDPLLFMNTLFLAQNYHLSNELNIFAQLIVFIIIIKNSLFSR